ncbi:MAG: hypothetical protein ABI903_00660 [Actinomycetota bacterium]
MRSPVGAGDGDLCVEFCGEWFTVTAEETFSVGRDADLCLDDNPFLHRRFLQICFDGRLWWLENVGARLSATICDTSGGVQSWLPPGGHLPLVFGVTTVIFTAGPTSYEFSVHIKNAAYLRAVAFELPVGQTTVGATQWTPSQMQVIVALAEPMLRREGSGLSAIPSSADAAKRLGWALTRFNRKLDNVCDKLDRLGVRGMRGGPLVHASNRRSRLVEYALSSRIVTAEDLPLLEPPSDAQ